MPSRSSKSTATGSTATSNPTSRASSTKRKTPATSDSDDLSTPPKRSRPSIADLVGSQGGSSNISSSPAHLLDAASLKSSPPEVRSCDPVKPRTFAEMYTFASRSRPNGVIDLTRDKSPSSPINGMNSLRLNGINGTGPKKLVVKNLRTAPRVDPEEFFERKWKEQSAALDRLFAGDDASVKKQLEVLCKATEHICRQGKSEELFKRIHEKSLQHLVETVRPQLAKLCDGGVSVPALQAFVDAWHTWQGQVRMVKQIYFYLNQSWVIRKQELGDLTQVGMQAFRGVIWHDLDVKEVVLESTVELVQRDRKGETNENALLEDAVTVLRDLQVYTADLEQPLLDASRKWFREWRREEAEKADLPHYVRACSDLFDKEMTRCDVLSLDRSTRTALSDMFDEILVEENTERLSNEDALLDMLEQNQEKELAQSWTLLGRRKHELNMSPPFAKYIETEGTSIVLDENREDEMVVRLLHFHKRLNHIHQDCFGKNEDVGNDLHKAFEVFMNKVKRGSTNYGTDNAKPGEMIAKHIDLLMKGGAKAVPKLLETQAQGSTEAEEADAIDADDNEKEDESIERHLADALDLFRYVQGKAVFEAFYKKDLARRLLMGRTQSFDAERSMLARLRNECGANFTHNLESMFKDMDLAREEMKGYSQFLVEREKKPLVEIGVNVLSVAAWPTYPEVPCNLPTSILKAQHDFEQHYKDKHVGRKLTWKPSLAHCQLRARFSKAQKELVVSGFQAIVLLLFNDIGKDEALTYEQIKALTALPDAEVKRTLQSLACAKYKVLTKTPKGREVNETDTFAYNSSFTDSRFRVKINQIQLKETKEENKETHQRVAADRHYETQAAIVRIMKSRKRIGHNELIVEVIKATRSRGVLDQADIKKNIEKLIEKDYMEREDEIRGYSYLA